MDNLKWTTHPDGRQEAFVTFGIKDVKGRELGACLILQKEKTHYIGLCVSGRNGNVFGGGSYNPSYYASIDEAQAAVIAKAEQMKSKTLKKVQANFNERELDAIRIALQLRVEAAEEQDDKKTEAFYRKPLEKVRALLGIQ
jgi:hypothetical protein